MTVAGCFVVVVLAAVAGVAAVSAAGPAAISTAVSITKQTSRVTHTPRGYSEKKWILLKN